MPYYGKFGFRYEYTEKDFFVKNYERPVVDHGVVLRDMQYLSMELFGGK